jgi:hypothetical protein
MGMEIFFALINFAILVAVLGYVFMRSVLPGFAKELADILRQRFSWRRDSEQLNAKLQELTKLGGSQERTYQTLEQKVALWHQNLEKHHLQQHQDYCALNVSVHDRRQRQCAIFDAHKLSARILPHALAEAQLELYTYYQLENHGAEYINELVTLVEKRP